MVIFSPEAFLFCRSASVMAFEAFFSFIFQVEARKNCQYKKPVETVISRVLFPCTIQGGDHSSGMSIARHLTQPTRELRAGHSQSLPYLVLLRVGFTKPATSPPQLVSSYLTFSPLPGKGLAVYFLWHFP